MKATGKQFIFIFTFLALVASAYAKTPREELQQMVEQLKQSPNNNTLREKIIKLAPTLKPSPALPDEAITFEGRAQFAFRSAKSEDDFLVAAREYEKAAAAAPWVLGYYADLCTIYEKAGKFEDAKRHCGFYLTSLTDSAQIINVKRRIAGLEFGIEKANSPQVREATLLNKVNCPWQNGGGSTTITVDYGRSSLMYVENFADGRFTPVIVSQANITEDNISWTQTEEWDNQAHIVSYNLSRISGELNYSYYDGQPKTNRRNCVTGKPRF
jgi:hypothetical protein